MSLFARITALFFIVGILLFCFCNKAHAQIIVKPWDSNYTSINESYNQIPKCWTNSSPIIIESVSPKELMVANLLIYPDGDDVDEIKDSELGLYLPKRIPNYGQSNLPDIAMILFARNKMTDAKIKQCFPHEWGHHVYHVLLTKEEVKEWSECYNCIYALGKLPTEYSATSELEGFAECFRAYLKNEPLDSLLKNYFVTLQNRILVKPIDINKMILPFIIEPLSLNRLPIPPSLLSLHNNTHSNTHSNTIKNPIKLKLKSRGIK